MHSCFSAPRGSAFNTSWRLWTAFCAELRVDTSLAAIPGDKILPLLQMFAHCYQHGSLTGRGQPIRSRTVEDAVQSVGQAFARMGSPDPCLNLDETTSILRIAYLSSKKEIARTRLSNRCCRTGTKKLKHWNLLSPPTPSHPRTAENTPPTIARLVKKPS